MNFDERYLASQRINLFCSDKPNFGGLKPTTKQFSKQKIGRFWFIKVHFVHLSQYTEQIFNKLMNLMNLDELTYYLWLLFAMDEREKFWNELVFAWLCSSNFIKFICESRQAKLNQIAKEGKMKWHRN